MALGWVAARGVRSRLTRQQRASERLAFFPEPSKCESIFTVCMYARAPFLVDRSWVTC